MNLQYSIGMHELMALTPQLTNCPGIYLVITQDRARQSKTDLIASLVLKGPLFVVAADEWLPGFLLPRILRGRTTAVKELSRRLRTVCASTSMRLLDSLMNIPDSGEPLLVLDFLQTFYDPNMRLALRLRVLRQCCDQLQRIGFQRPIIVMTQAMTGEDYERFIPFLRKVAQKTLYLESPFEPVMQPALF